MNKNELVIIVQSYLNHAKRKVAAFKNNVPGKGFAIGFLNRHKEKLQMRLVSNYSRKRASLSAAVINEYFNNLELTLRDIPLENIFNYDETNLTDNPGKIKCIIKRGAKYPQRILNETKSAISLMLCGIGELLPPYVCYKSKVGVFNTWRTGGPTGARYGRSLSGWFNGPTFTDRFKKIALPYLNKKQGPKVLFGYNLASHFSAEVLSLCKANNIR